jgi:hypothetical protein
MVVLTLRNKINKTREIKQRVVNPADCHASEQHFKPSEHIVTISDSTSEHIVTISDSTSELSLVDSDLERLLQDFDSP